MVVVSGSVAQHESPVWIQKADFILHVELADASSWWIKSSNHRADSTSESSFHTKRIESSAHVSKQLP